MICDYYHYNNPADGNKIMYAYGYKVCYREHGSTVYVRYFMTYTYKQASYARRSYILYPPRTREDNRKLLIKPIWRIIPISRDEMRAGIWRECPF